MALGNNGVWDNLTDYSGPPAGITGIDAGPEFDARLSEDRHLTVDSACMDAGTTVHWLHLDHEGDICPRCWFDIGGDEHSKEFSVLARPLVLKNYSPRRTLCPERGRLACCGDDLSPMALSACMVPGPHPTVSLCAGGLVPVCA